MKAEQDQKKTDTRAEEQLKASTDDARKQEQNDKKSDDARKQEQSEKIAPELKAEQHQKSSLQAEQSNKKANA